MYSWWWFKIHFSSNSCGRTQWRYTFQTDIIHLRAFVYMIKAFRRGRSQSINDFFFCSGVRAAIQKQSDGTMEQLNYYTFVSLHCHRSNGISYLMQRASIVNRHIIIIIDWVGAIEACVVRIHDRARRIYVYVSTPNWFNFKTKAVKWRTCFGKSATSKKSKIKRNEERERERGKIENTRHRWKCCADKHRSENMNKLQWFLLIQLKWSFVRCTNLLCNFCFPHKCALNSTRWWWVSWNSFECTRSN